MPIGGILFIMMTDQGRDGAAMNPIIHQRPEPICETLALLYISENLDNLIRLMTAAIDAEGGDGMAFYHAHESLHRRYTAAFRDRAVYDDFYDFFFHQMGIGDYVIIALPFLIDKNLTYDADEREEDALRALLSDGYRLIYNSGMIGFDEIEQAQDLEAYIACGASGDELCAVVERPKFYLSALARMVRENVPVMEDAWVLVREEAQAFLASSWNSAEEFYEKGIVERGAQIRHIYPQLSLYTSSFFIDDAYYYGMFNADERPEEIRNDEKLFFTGACKAMSDPTRMEILLLLKQRPWYNRELAQALGLTPATIMHHTDILLQNGLAAMTTDGENQKRIYFSLVPEKLEKMRAVLAKLFDLE